MRKYLLGSVLLVTTGIGVSTLLIPDADDISPQARDASSVASASSAPAAPVIAALPAQEANAAYGSGDRRIEVIAGMAQAAIDAGDRPQAIALWEAYVDANPADAPGLGALAAQYQLAGQQEAYLDTYARQVALAPSVQGLRTLSDLYNAARRYPDQAKTLEQLNEFARGSDPAIGVDLATIRHVIGDKAGAKEAMRALRAAHPDYQHFAATRMDVILQAESGEGETAYGTAMAWLSRAENTAPIPTEIADLCNILHYSGHAALAVALVEPHRALLPSSPDLAEAYVRAAITDGRQTEAYAVLRQIEAAGALNPPLATLYTDLALAQGEFAEADRILAALDPHAFNEEQVLVLLDVARRHTSDAAVKSVSARFSTPAVLEGKPVLAAILGILQNVKHQDALLETAINAPLSATQRGRLAQSCAQAGKSACLDAMLKQYPPIDAMSPAQLVEFAQIHLSARRAGEILEPFGQRAQATSLESDVRLAHRRLAAAAGSAETLTPWLQENANHAAVSHLTDLFYLAGDHGHHAIAADIAQRLYARDASPQHRQFVIASALQANDHARALPLLREQVRDPGADDSLYLATLAKIARKDGSARNELTSHAEAALKSGRGSTRQQIGYAYILLNNGRKEAAVPIIRTRAQAEGGEWKKMLAQLTPSQSNVASSARPASSPALTVDQRIAMAHAPATSRESRRQIAFSLLNDGHKTEALPLFRQLAEQQAPDSEEVRDLLYLWGTPLPAEALSWVESRARTASAYEKPKWAALVGNQAGDEAVLRFVSATPESLYHRPLRQRYFTILAKTGNRAHYETAMREWVAKTTDIPALVDYAAVAEAHGLREAARTGYARVLALAPNHPKALSQLAALDYAKGQYQSADAKVSAYLSANVDAVATETNPAQAHFYKAELLRREGKEPAAMAEYRKVVELTPEASSAPDARSRLYTTFFRLGEHARAKQGFEALLAENPGDQSVLADYMSALIEYRYLSEASQIANRYDKSAAGRDKGAALMGTSSHLIGVEQRDGGQSVTLRFAEAIDARPPIDARQLNSAPWLASHEARYDSVTIAAKPGYTVVVTPTSQESFALVASRRPLTPQEQLVREQTLRLQLLYARMEQESGNEAAATERLRILKLHYPNEPQLISYEASLASAAGDMPRAKQLAQQAKMLAPEHEDIALLAQNIEQARVYSGSTGNFVKLDQAYRAIGKNNEHITTLSGSVLATDRAELGFNLQNDFLDTRNTRRGRDGAIGNYSLDRQRGEVFAAYRFDSGERLQVSAFANNDTAGMGGYLTLPARIGQIQLIAEYRRPYWDFVEAVAEDTTRDRVGFTLYSTLQPGTTLGVETSVNNYNIALQDDVRETALIRASLQQQLQPQTAHQPYLGVGYGFDGEYRIGSAPYTRLDGFGNPYQPFPLVDREFHSLTGTYRDDWGRDTHAQLTAGMAYDRVSSAFSPLVDTRIGHDINAHWQIGGRARYALQTNNTDNRQLDAGVDLIYKF